MHKNLTSDYLEHIQACKEIFITKGWFLSVIIGGIVSVASLAYAIGVNVAQTKDFKDQTIDKLVHYNLRLSHIEATIPDLDTIKQELRELNKKLP
jgi:hypothetical protein